MENNYNNTPDDNSQNTNTYDDPNSQAANTYNDPNAQAGNTYTDPNAQTNNTYQDQSNQQDNYQQSNYQQDNYQQPTYQQPNYQQQYNPNQGADESPMTVKDWIITLLIFCIPCVNIVMYFVWAFGKTGNVSRRNYCRAQLIFVAAGIVLYLILIIAFGASFASIMNSY
ncbi:MAG: hypothetical protein ACK5LL_13050 [Suipraeoptans sp.]